MVKIRYSELPAGLHVSAETRGRSTIIYLLPGLTAPQRRAALIRVRSSSRMGQGPRLPVAGMVLAVGVDRIRTTVRNGAAAMRGHPLLLLPPLILLVSCAIVFLLMSFVTLTVHQPRQDSIPSLVVHPAHHVAGGSRPAGTAGQHGNGPGSGADPRSHPPSASSRPHASPPATSFPAPAPSDDPAPSPSASATPSPTADPSPSATPAPSPSSSGGCLKLGPLGLCVHV
jgi:hypothetical protein